MFVDEVKHDRYNRPALKLLPNPETSALENVPVMLGSQLLEVTQILWPKVNGPGVDT